MRGLIFVGAVLASLAATPTAACSLINWNMYEDISQPSLVRLAEEAATIDWIAVEAGPVHCPRASEAEPESAPPPCRGRFEWSEGDFSGRVIERLKGESEDRFALLRWVNARWQGFSDIREMGERPRSWVVDGARNRADSHADLSFWDRGALQFLTDGTDSCGGAPSLDPDARYVVFREASGSVLALEPVIADDDRLLQRLRARRTDPQASMREQFPVEQFFRSAEGVVLTRVGFCRGGGQDYESERARLTAVRGSPAFILDGQWSVGGSTGSPSYQHGAPGSITFRYDDLWDYFALRGERCPSRGEQVLIVQPTFEEPRYGLHRPVRISPDGTLKVADLFTALDLTGPETVTVDQVFAWFEEGRAARAVSPVPSSS